MNDFTKGRMDVRAIVPMTEVMLQKVLVTDDHAVLRIGLLQLLRGLLPQASLLEAGSRLEMLSLLQQHPDVGLLLLDLSLPDAHGLRTAEEALALRPLLPIAVVSSVADPALVRHAMRMGLVGYIPKTTQAQMTENALRLLLSGGSYWPREIAEAAIRPPSTLPQLGERQREVLDAVCRGLSNKQVALELGLTEATVKAHLTTVFRALKVNSRSQAIALRHRLAGAGPASG